MESFAEMHELVTGNHIKYIYYLINSDIKKNLLMD